MTLSGIETDLGEYRLLERIAVGGMAEVYLAEAKDPEKHGGAGQVVVKRLLPNHRADKAYVELFLDEARLSVKLRHPNIVRTFKAFKKGLDYYMIQEYVDGGSLESVLLRLKARRLRLPPQATVAVMVGLLKALDYVHRARLGEQHVALVHRDVNPGNILVSRAGVVKLTDFGVAEGEGLGAKRVHGALRGTPPYMAPEQVRGKRVDPRTDLFSAGIVFWELLTGRDLFRAEAEYETLRKVVEHEAAPPSVYASRLPEAFDTIVARALAKDPEKRFRSASHFGRDLVLASKAFGWGTGDSELLGQAVTHALGHR
ncbi:MAG: serine/threonine protein kinase [Deltaproteobacteria bacterium]|nr:MAG: serine/threonine protein kinase [Deltaproteobacteria bacterium]